MEAALPSAQRAGAGRPRISCLPFLLPGKPHCAVSALMVFDSRNCFCRQKGFGPRGWQKMMLCWHIIARVARCPENSIHCGFVFSGFGFRHVNKVAKFGTGLFFDAFLFVNITFYIDNMYLEQMLLYDCQAIQKDCGRIYEKFVQQPDRPCWYGHEHAA